MALQLFARRLQQLMDERHLTQLDVARGIRRSPSLISQVLLAGRSSGDGNERPDRWRRVSFDTLDRCARFFGVQVSELFLDPSAAPGITLSDRERAAIEALRESDDRTRSAIAIMLGLSGV